MSVTPDGDSLRSAEVERVTSGVHVIDTTTNTVLTFISACAR